MNDSKGNRLPPDADVTEMIGMFRLDLNWQRQSEEVNRGYFVGTEAGIAGTEPGPTPCAGAMSPLPGGQYRLPEDPSGPLARGTARQRRGSARVLSPQFP